MRHFSFRPALTFRGRKFLGLRGFTGKLPHPPLSEYSNRCLHDYTKTLGIRKRRRLRPARVEEPSRSDPAHILPTESEQKSRSTGRNGEARSFLVTSRTEIPQ